MVASYVIADTLLHKFKLLVLTSSYLSSKLRQAFSNHSFYMMLLESIVGEFVIFYNYTIMIYWYHTTAYININIIKFMTIFYIFKRYFIPYLFQLEQNRSGGFSPVKFTNKRTYNKLINSINDQKLRFLLRPPELLLLIFDSGCFLIVDPYSGFFRLLFEIDVLDSNYGRICSSLGSSFS